jgi:hypothetical protein
MPRTKKQNLGLRHGSVRGRPTGRKDTVSRLKTLVETDNRTEDQVEEADEVNEETVIESTIDLPEEIKRDEIMNLVNKILDDKLKLYDEETKKTKEQTKAEKKRQKELERELAKKERELEIAEHKKYMEELILKRGIIDTQKKIDGINYKRTGKDLLL